MLRAAKDTDFLSIWSIYMEDSTNPFMDYEVMDATQFKQKYDEYNKTSQFYVYQQDENIIGICRLTYSKKPHQHVVLIGSVAVKQDYRQRGIANAMLQELIELIKITSPQIIRIELLVEDDNPGAIRLYEKLGFNKEVTYPNWFKRYAGPYQDKGFMSSHLMSLLIRDSVSSNVNLSNRREEKVEDQNKVFHWHESKTNDGFPTWICESEDKILAHCFLKPIQNTDRCRLCNSIDSLVFDRDCSITLCSNMLIKLIELQRQRGLTILLLNISSTDQDLFRICSESGLKYAGSLRAYYQLTELN